MDHDPNRPQRVLWTKEVLTSQPSADWIFFDEAGLDEFEKFQIRQLLSSGTVTITQRKFGPAANGFGPEPQRTEVPHAQLPGPQATLGDPNTTPKAPEGTPRTRSSPRGVIPGASNRTQAAPQRTAPIPQGTTPAPCRSRTVPEKQTAHHEASFNGSGDPITLGTGPISGSRRSARSPSIPSLSCPLPASSGTGLAAMSFARVVSGTANGKPKAPVHSAPTAQSSRPASCSKRHEVNDVQTQNISGFEQPSEDLLLAIQKYLEDFQMQPDCAARPRGISNRGNDCFIIATLQALFAVPYLAGFLNRLNKLLIFHNCSIESLQRQCPFLMGMCLQWRNYTKEDANSSGEGHSPLRVTNMRDVLKVLHNKDLTAGQQCDATEFYVILFNKMQNEVSKIRLGGLFPNNCLSESFWPAVARDDQLEGWQEVKNWRKLGRRQNQMDADPTCPLNKMFGVKIRRKYWRSDAEGHPKASARFEDINYPCLELAIQGAPTLKDALGIFFALETETINTDELQQAKACLTSLPACLVFCLSNVDEDYRKSKKQIRFDLSLRLENDWLDSIIQNTPHRYELTSGVFHKGSGTNGGHYLSFSRSEDGQFFLFNDAHVSKCTYKDIENYHRTLRDESTVVSCLIYSDNQFSDRR